MSSRRGFFVGKRYTINIETKNWVAGGRQKKTFTLLGFFVATCTAAIFSEVMARVRKYPAISYLVISLLPLIPGAGIYYTALYAIRADFPQAAGYGMDTLATAGVMAAGILVISTVVRMWTTHKKG